MPTEQKNDNVEIHSTAIEAFDRIQSAVQAERKLCLEDRRFYSISGAQWEGQGSEQFENKPKLEINKIHNSIIRIFNEYRNNRITVDFVSKDGANTDLSDVCDGLYRSDEQDSGAEEAYDNAFEEGVGGGFGAWRLRACREDEYNEEEDERQRIKIEPIFEADSCVFFDLNAKRQDKKDAKYCFVLIAKNKEDYESEYGEIPASFNREITGIEFDWFSPEIVYIAEYYVKEDAYSAVYVYKDLIGNEEKYTDDDFKNDDLLEQTLEASGSRKVRGYRVKTCKIHKYILSGDSILEDCGYIAGKEIPIVPFYAKRWFIDSIERCMGHVRLAKDPQRVKNMQASALLDTAARSPVEKPIFTPEQMQGHAMAWAEDMVSDNPYLLVNPMTDINGNKIPSGPVGYTKPPQIPPAMAALLQLTETDIADLLGNPQQADKMVSNISGKAVELIQERIDGQTFIYLDNFAKAMRRSGEIWLSMARELYVEEKRKMKAINKDKSVSTIEIAKPIITEEGQSVEYENDMSSAAFDVVATVGPSSSSKKAAIVRAITGIMAITQDPETIQILSAIALMNMEGEGLDDIRAFYRWKLIRMGVLKPTKQEAQQLQQELANQQDDPSAVFLQAAAEEAAAKAAKARADVVDTIADSQLKRAKTAKTLAEVESENVQTAQTAFQAAQNAVSQNLRYGEIQRNL